MIVNIELECVTEPATHGIELEKNDDLEFVSITAIYLGEPNSPAKQVTVHLKIDELKKAIDKIAL
jgi:hypothetical protein